MRQFLHTLPNLMGQTGTGEDDRVPGFADDLAGRRNVDRIRIQIMELLPFQRHSIGRHFGNILGQVDMGRTRLALFCVLERQPDDLAHRIRADDLL